MSPAKPRRFVVKAFDYEVWIVTVEARSRDEAIAKAQNIYNSDRFGEASGFEIHSKDFFFRAEPILQEVLS